MNRRWLIAALAFSGLPLLAVIGYWLHFTQYMVYDDEGYVLWSLHNYILHGGLYTKVYSQYGPLFYAAYDAMHWVTGLEFTNTAGRWITLSFWCATSWIGGAFAWRATRSVPASLAALALTFAALTVMSSEPIHPGGPLAFLSALGAWCGGLAVLQGRPRLFVASTAVAGAAMLAIKINVGVFFFIAAASWLALHTRMAAPRSRTLEWMVLLGCVGSPFLLMRDRIGEPGYAQFALVFTAGAAGVALLLRRGPRATDHSPQAWAAFTGIAVLTVAAAALAVVARGTAWVDLLNGMVIAPLNQPLSFSLPPRWQPTASLLALASLGAVWWVVSRPTWSPALRLTLAVARLAAFAVVAWVGLHAEEHTVGRYLFYYGTSLAWLFALPLRDETPRHRAFRLWLAWVFVWQTLHAFPVAGSQVAWGALLAAPLLVIGAHEAILVLAGSRPRIVVSVTALLLGVALVPTAALLRTGWLYHGVSIELGLPGAEKLRVPANIANCLRAMSRNATLHGGTLFSHPGMFSFNLWTNIPTPTTANVTLWSTLLTESQQDAIRARLASDPRAVIIGQEYVLNHLIAQGFAPRGPLNDYLVHNFAPAFRVETYVFWVRRGRSIAPVGTARLERAAGVADWNLEVITDTTGAPVTWEIWTNGFAYLLAAGSLSEAVPQVQSLDLSGTAASPAQPFGGEPLAGRLTRLTWRIPPARLPGVDDLELRLLDADGRLVERVPFRR